ncbi:SERPIN domain-containing protein [Aphelenchoides fujianensis]|nr:SERPIN domain-containing protein [Aphelenchoides fujianensis]
MAHLAFEAAQADFAVGLLREVALNSNASVILSPISIAFALSLVYAGAEGDTRREFEAAFARGGIKGDALDALFHRSLAQLATGERHARIPMETCSLKRYLLFLPVIRPWANACPTRSPHSRLLVVNRAYASHELDVKAAYKRVVDEKFGGHFKRVDFGRPAEAVAEINAFVAAATDDQIRDLLAVEAVDRRTKMMLVNALCFKGRWDDRFQFDEDATTNATFFLDESSEKQVQMMRMTEHVRYTETKDVQVLELGYADERAKFVVFLPKEQFGLTAWLRKVDGGELLGLMDRLEWREVNIKLPRFAISSEFELKDVLSALGFSRGFSEVADFGGISDQPLFISRSIHQAFIHVNEYGTEAAAATANEEVVLSGGADDPIDFRADHPFAFLLTYDKTPLFFGRFSGSPS